MKKMVMGFGLMMVAMVALTVGAFAEETYPGPHEAGPNIYSKQFENDRVCVSEIKFNPGDKIAMHTHIYDHFVYVLEPGQLTLSYPDGKTSVVNGTAGQVLWIVKESHAAKNTGTTVFRALVVELKP